MIGRLINAIEQLVWGDTLRQYGIAGRLLTGILRNLYAVLRDVFSGQLTLRAMSLVFTTLLSIVPLVAVSFLALNAFDVRKDIEPRLYGFLEPLGPTGAEWTSYIINLVDNVNVNVLGGVGLIFFLYTAISMVQKVEEAFNYVWYVTKSRSFMTRLVEYSTVLIVGAIAVGLGVKALIDFSKEKLVVEMTENVVLAPVFTLTDRLMPYMIMIGIFTALYKFMPNTLVRFKSALVGGIAGGFLWTTTAAIFSTFIANSSNRQAIYASLAVAISGLIWLYLNWLILLIGAQIAFYFQNPAYLRIGRREPRLSNAMRERIAMNIMYLVGKEHRSPVLGVTMRSLGRVMRIPTITLEPIARGLEAAGMLTSNEKEQLLPGKEISRIRIGDILETVRQVGETGSHREPHWEAAIDDLADSLDSAVASRIGDKTLADLLDDDEEQPAA